MGRLAYLYILVFWTTIVNAKVSISIDGSHPTMQSSVHILEGQNLTIQSNEYGNWVKISPCLHEYDNLKNGARSIEPIIYNIDPLMDNPSDSILTINDIKAGTYYYGNVNKLSKSIITTKPIHLIHDNIIQIVVRKNNSYIGFLTEQLNLPFIIPPKLLYEFGHQTDLNIGTDCAELAIYGMRRLGYDIPYGGPKGIIKYLAPTDSIFTGTIIHYGFQVSIVYEDRGIKGKLDKEDLLIHAFDDKVKIEKLGDTRLVNKYYKQYRWSIENNTE